MQANDCAVASQSEIQLTSVSHSSIIKTSLLDVMKAPEFSALVEEIFEREVATLRQECQTFMHHMESKCKALVNATLLKVAEDYEIQGLDSTHKKPDKTDSGSNDARDGRTVHSQHSESNASKLGVEDLNNNLTVHVKPDSYERTSDAQALRKASTVSSNISLQENDGQPSRLKICTTGSEESGPVVHVKTIEDAVLEREKSMKLHSLASIKQMEEVRRQESRESSLVGDIKPQDNNPRPSSPTKRGAAMFQKIGQQVVQAVSDERESQGRRVKRLSFTSMVNTLTGDTIVSPTRQKTEPSGSQSKFITLNKEERREKRRSALQHASGMKLLAAPRTKNYPLAQFPAEVVTPVSASARLMSSFAFASSDNDGDRGGSSTGDRLQEIFNQADVWLHGFVIDEMGHMRRFWDFVIFSSLVWCCFSIPFNLAFIWPDKPRHWTGYMVIVNDIVFNLDVLLNFFTTFRNKEGLVQWDIPVIAKNYASTWLLLDVFSSVPFDRIVYNFISSDATWPPFFRLLRLLTLFKFDIRFQHLERFMKNPFYLRMMKFLLIIVVFVHWFTCVTHVAAKSSDNPDLWIGFADYTNHPNFVIYTRVFYFVSVSMIGESSDPQDMGQVLISLVVFWAGLFMYFTLFSNLVSILINMNLPQVEYNKRKDMRLTYMKNLNLKEDLRLRILDYFSELHSVTKGVDHQMFMHTLPHHLRQEVAFSLTEKSLESLKFLEKCPLPFVTALMMRLKLFICLQGDMLCIEGDIGDEMYFVTSGELHVFKQSVGKIGILREGAIFGEKLLLEEKGRRQASVKAAKACTLYSLSKPMFLEIQAAYPDTTKVLFEKTEEDES